MSRLVELCAEEGDSSLPSAEDTFTLASRIVERAGAKHVMIGSAESCTGGLVSAAITAVPGSSVCMQGGVASYAFSAKTSVLGVSQDTLDSVGAVSHECAREMAEGARRVLAADVCASTTGIAGPSGAVPGKPVGTVCFGITTPSGTHTAQRLFTGDRDEVRAKATYFALELIFEGIEETEILD